MTPDPQTPPSLPELPDLDSLRQIVIKRRDYFQNVIAEAQVQIDDCDEHLSRLGFQVPAPEKTARGGKLKKFSDSAYEAVLNALATRNYANAGTLATDTYMSRSSVLNIMNAAEVRGHVTRELREGRKPHRFVITDAGQDWVTRPRQNPTATEA